jgi:alkylated DNA repair dioxygenase AlkB
MINKLFIHVNSAKEGSFSGTHIMGFSMATLFPLEPVFPEGFGYFPGFISSTEEERLIGAIAGLALHPMIFHGYTANRKTTGFGYDYSFTSRQLSRGKPIPEAFHSLIEKVGDKIAVPPGDLAQLLVTEYPPGSVINWHRDAPPFDIIAGISLAADCIFRLRPHEKAKQTRSSVISFPVERGSLYVIKNTARSEWEHSITPVKQTRYSITLRTLK